MNNYLFSDGFLDDQARLTEKKRNQSLPDFISHTDEHHVYKNEVKILENIVCILSKFTLRLKEIGNKWESWFSMPKPCRCFKLAL